MIRHSPMKEGRADIQQIAYRVSSVVARLLVLATASLLLLGVLLVVFTQYAPVRDWGVDQALDALNDAIPGAVDVGEVRGDLITGIELLDVALTTDYDTLATFPRVLVAYDPIGILRRKDVVATVLIDEPSIHLVRQADGTWSVEQFIGPTDTTDDGPRTPLDWVFDLSSVEIRDGELIVEDRTRIGPGRGDSAPIGAFDPLDLHVDRLYLEAGTYFSETEQILDLRRLGFRDLRSGLRVVDVVGGLRIDSDGLRIEDLALETQGSYLELSASIATPPLLDSTFASSILDASFDLRLEAERISTDELETLVPSVDMLDGSPAIDLVARGRLDSLVAESIRIEIGRSRIEAEGLLTNITDPSLWRIEAAAKESSIDVADVERLLPFVDLSSIRTLGRIEVASLTYSGTPNDLVGTLDVSTEAGNVAGGGSLSFADGPLWRSDLTLDDVDLGRIVAGFGVDLEGVVNGRVVAEGTGFDPATMKSRLRARLGNSTVAGRSISAGWVAGAFGEEGRIVIDTAMFGFGSSAYVPTAADPVRLVERLQAVRTSRTLGELSESFTLEGDLSGRIDGQPSARVSGWIDLATEEYSGAVETDRFDLSSVTLDPSQSTRIGAVAFVEGVGFDPDVMQTRLLLQASDVLLPDGTELGPFRIDSLVLATEGGERRLSLSSDVAELEIIGSWRFSSLVPTLASGFEKLIGYVARKSTYGAEEVELLTDLFDVDSEPESIYVTYMIEPKDLRIVRSFVPDLDLEVDGRLTGNITGTTDLLGLTTRGEIDRLRYNGEGIAVSADDVDLDIEVRNIAAGAMDDLLTADIEILSDRPYVINDTRYGIPSLALTFDDGRLRFSTGGTIDGEYPMTVAGSIDVVDDDRYRLLLDTLSFALDDRLRWQTRGQSDIIVGSSGVDIGRLEFERTDGELVSLRGRFADYERFEGVEISVASMPVSRLSGLLPVGETERAFETLGGQLDTLSVSLGGTLENPIIDLDVDLVDLSYSGVSVGSIGLEIAYNDRNATGAVVIRSLGADTASAPDLLAEIDIRSIPIDLAFSAREERFDRTRKFDVVGKTTGLPLAILAPFVPGILIRGGETSLDFSVSGRYPDVDYQGTGRIDKGLVIVESTNIPYFLDARFGLLEDKLEISGATLRNLPSDYAPGRATAYGDIQLDGFVPSRFNLDILTAPEGLLVLSDATEAVNDFYYGELVVANERGDPIKFGGSLEYPTLTGDLVILRSDITYPYRETVGEYSGRVEFVDYDEWKEQSSRPALVPVPEGVPDSVIGRRTTDTTVTSRQPRRSNTPDGPSPEEVGTFMDRLRIDISITIPRSAGLNIEIGPVQQLNLLVNNGDEPLSFTMQGSSMTLDGRVNLLDRSRFIFLKTFEATGWVDFDRREDIANPELNITGVYSGRRTYNGATENYDVTVNLTGFLDLLNLAFQYSIDGVSSVTDDPVQRQADALLLLLLGRRQSELFGGPEGVGGEQAREVLGGGIDAVASNPLGALLSGVFSDIEGLQEVNFDANVEDPGRTRVSLLYELGQVLLRYDGRVTELSDGTVTVEVPLGLLLDVERLRNFSLELQRDVLDEFDGGLGGSGVTDEELYRLRLSLRWTW